MTGDMRFVQVWCCSRHYDGERLFQPMIVCLCCGNKRCPKATDHRLPCTQSNDPGQPGSACAEGATRTAGLGGEPLALRTADYIAALEQESETLRDRVKNAEAARDVALAQEKHAWETLDKYGWETSYGEMRTTRDALQELAIRVAQIPCAQVQADSDAPTCRSPLAGEGRPRDRWCVYCVARELLPQGEQGVTDEREMCVHCGRHPTAFQEVQALREELWRTTTAAAEELATLQERAEKAEEESKANQHDFLMMLANRNELSDEWVKLKDQVEEMRLNFDGNLTAMGHPPHSKCKFRRVLEETDQ